MSYRHTLRATAAAALTALAGFAAHAVEATQWEPEAQPAELLLSDTTIAVADTNSGPSTADLGEATEFRYPASTDEPVLSQSEIDSIMAEMAMLDEPSGSVYDSDPQQLSMWSPSDEIVEEDPALAYQ